ncbi:hypothetical protein OE88DRAFT_1655326 [Heliocybe sulcata]|uniref:HIT-type domain-containing protein n=1 Tax=Heliocybe sulcata TaxID=5364 RepID=A0A5C3NLS9_9AGAM|nr:hypothetical protein OE88DRAFT_1655326 [Heliocybe sulcata]
MPRTRALCQVCREHESKYTCSKCMIVYCSVSCYKTHKEQACASGTNETPAVGDPVLEPVPSTRHEDQTAPQGHLTAQDPSEHETGPLRPLTSLKWPYVPEESAYPDPLKRDDPKPLQLYQYESIATSEAVRKALKSHPSLPAVLRQIDSLRGQEREDALQQALGVSGSDDLGQSGSRNPESHRFSSAPIVKSDEERDALRALAEAVESAVRGNKEGALGLDWEGNAS